MELAVNDLEAHIEAKRRQRLNLHCIRSIAQQALSALAYLHEKNVTHRDLKLCNILVTMWERNSDILTIKLADFSHLKLQIQASHRLRNRRIHGS